MSKVRVYVEWEKPVVFAGEEVKCTITVANEAEVPARPVSSNPVIHGRRLINNGQKIPLALDKNEKNPSSQTGSHFARSGNEGATSEGLRSQEYSVTANSRADKPNDSKCTTSNPVKHARSVSIVSLGGSPKNVSQRQQDRVGSLQSPTPSQNRRHGQAASFQGSRSRSQDDSNMNFSASPRVLNSVFSRDETTTSIRVLRPTGTQTPQDLGRRQTGAPLLDDIRDSSQGVSSAGTVRLTEGRSRSALVHSISHFNRNGQTTRSITPLSPIDTPRTSIDLTSPSNNSTETLVSEYIRTSVGGPRTRLPNERQSSHLGQSMSDGQSPMTLIMGYACLTGSFMLEESLINTSLFEEVRKSTIGWQGSGGVVGIGTKKRDSGLLGNIGWHNLGESLGGLLKTTEPSTLRNIKGVAKTSAIPIISTPQTVLFVDLRLKPGQAKSFTYNHLLPIDIPATYKGRAIKISYGLVIGVQKQQMSLQQHPIRHVEVPFRVLPGVNADGDIVKHDLMCPYVQMKNYGTLANVGDRSRDSVKLGSRANGSLTAYDPSKLVSYVQDLLSNRSQGSGHGLISPTEPATHVLPETCKAHICAEDIINGIFKRGLTWPRFGPSRYQIQRDGGHIAMILLSRPVYRIGEAIPIVVDFRTAETPCHSLRIYLESLELIDPAVALRSELSTQRATRRVHASRSEYTSCGTRISVSLTIPISGTPDFATSCVNLIWRLRIEFFTVIESIHNMTYGHLMEEVVKDDRGRILAARDEIHCDSFEVIVPLRVFGTRGCSTEQKLASTAGLLI